MDKETLNMSEFSFANNFWGKDDTGVNNLLHRMHESKQTFEEVHLFFKERIAIEEDYAKRMLALSRRPLGSGEIGSIRHALETIRINTEAISKSHNSSAQQLRKELDDPLESFANSTRQRRKTVEGTVDKLLKAKAAQNSNVEKARTRYESDCNKLNGYYAQQSLLMGRELERNNAKLEKVQMTIDSSKVEYQSSLRVLAETIDRWNKEWKESCDKFQDLEEERISFLKSNLWAYANVVSTVCVSDDEGCENIRVALEKCDVSKDLETFVRAKGTGSEILDPPEFVNFLQGYSRESTADQFKVAKFRRGSEEGGASNYQDGYFDHKPVPPNRSDTIGYGLPNRTSTINSGISPNYEQEHAENNHISLNSQAIPVLSHNFIESDRSTQASPMHSTTSPNSSVYSNATSISSQSDVNDQQEDHEIGAKKRTWASPFGKRRSKKDLSKGWNSFSRSQSFSGNEDESHGYSNSISAGDLTITNKTAAAIGKQFTQSPHHPRPQHANRASVLGMGDNMFDLGLTSNTNKAVESVHSRTPSPAKKTLSRDDPLLAALERLKVSTSTASPSPSQASLVAPEPAFTADEMHAASSKYSKQTKQLFSYDEQEEERQPRSTQRPKSSIDLRSGQIPRATSPNPSMGGPYQIAAPTVRERPKSQYIENTTSGYNVNSYREHHRSKSQSPTKVTSSDYRRAASPNPYDNRNRATSPAPTNARSVSPAPSMQRYQQQQQQQQYEYANTYQKSRPRSKSSVDIRNMKQAHTYPATTSDDRPVVRYSRAAYDYRAAIPEEVSFRKGDTLLVTQMQEDGWWEVEVMSTGRYGLAPSNFLVNA